MRLHSLLAIAAVCCGFGLPAAAQVPAPILTTLDSAGDVGLYSDVALRPDGRGVVAYTDSTNADLKVASCADVACTSAALATIDTDGPFQWVAVAIGPFGEPVIAYQRPASGTALQPTIRFAHCVDAACSSASVVPIDFLDSISPGTDVAVDPEGSPIVVYGEPFSAVRIARCLDFTCSERTLALHPAPSGVMNPVVVIGSDGLPVFAASHNADLRVGHCSNPSCSSATFALLEGDPSPPFITRYTEPSLAVGDDGRVVVAFRHEEFTLPPGTNFHYVSLQRCADVACTSLEFAGVMADDNGLPRVAVAPGNRPLVASYGGPVLQLELERCVDPICTATSSPVVIGGENDLNHAMAADRPGNALVSFYDAANRDLRVAWLGAPPELSIGDAAAFEGQAGQTLLHLPVSLTGGGNATVDFASADGTATSPSDYAPTSGSLTFTPGTTTLFVTVSVVGDVAVEPDEFFRVLLSNAQGAPVVDGEGIGTIRDDDAPRHLSISDASTIEGDGGFVFALFAATLDAPSTTPVSVEFATQGNTATEGVDYIGSSGAVSFAPGQTTRVVSVAVLGDLVAESDETFFLRLQNPQGAVIDDGEGVGTILNDDGTPEAPPLGELRHGASYAGDLAASSIPAADVDDFRIGQDPYASYEVVVDAVSGDAVPLTLERRGPGGAVLQTGTAAGTGSSVAMRWLVDGTAPVTGETVRIAGACGTACGPDDVYRVRAYETTLRAARFNNTGTQTTVLLLQNPTDAPVSYAVFFWSADGTLAQTYAPAQPIPPHGLLVLNTAAPEGVPSGSGSLSVAHDAPYGVLAGKAVALEPATGFAFDTPLEPKPR